MTEKESEEYNGLYLSRMRIRLYNAVIIALITFVSGLTLSYPPTMANLYASLLAFLLTLLIQARNLLQDYENHLALKSKEKREKEDTVKESGKLYSILLLI